MIVTCSCYFFPFGFGVTSGDTHEHVKKKRTRRAVIWKRGRIATQQRKTGAAQVKHLLFFAFVLTLAVSMVVCTASDTFTNKDALDLAVNHDLNGDTTVKATVVASTSANMFWVQILQPLDQSIFSVGKVIRPVFRVGDSDTGGKICNKMGFQCDGVHNFSRKNYKLCVSVLQQNVSNACMELSLNVGIDIVTTEVGQLILKTWIQNKFTKKIVSNIDEKMYHVLNYFTETEAAKQNISRTSERKNKMKSLIGVEKLARYDIHLKEIQHLSVLPLDGFPVKVDIKERIPSNATEYELLFSFHATSEAVKDQYSIPLYSEFTFFPQYLGRHELLFLIRNRSSKQIESNELKMTVFVENKTLFRKPVLNHDDFYHACFQSGSDKCAHHRYDRFYYRYLPQSNSSLTIGEIGFYHGSSLRMWKSLYPHARVNILDIHPPDFSNIFDVNLSNINVIQGDAALPYYLTQLGNLSLEYGGYDIIVDDASHLPQHQYLAFKTLFSFLKPGGIYIIEDIEKSYWEGDSPEYFDLVALLSKTVVECVNTEFTQNTCTDSKGRKMLIEFISFAHNAIIIGKPNTGEEWILERPYRNVKYQAKKLSVDIGKTQGLIRQRNAFLQNTLQDLASRFVTLDTFQKKHVFYIIGSSFRLNTNNYNFSYVDLVYATSIKTLSGQIYSSTFNNIDNFGELMVKMRINRCFSLCFYNTSNQQPVLKLKDLCRPLVMDNNPHTLSIKLMHCNDKVNGKIPCLTKYQQATMRTNKFRLKITHYINTLSMNSTKQSLRLNVHKGHVSSDKSKYVVENVNKNIELSRELLPFELQLMLGISARFDDTNLFEKTAMALEDIQGCNTTYFMYFDALSVPDRSSPLHIAAAYGSKRVVLVILEMLKRFKTFKSVVKCFPINSQNAYGHSPIHLALEKNNLGIGEMLIEFLLDWDKRGNSELQYSEYYTDVVRTYTLAMQMCCRMNHNDLLHNLIDKVFVRNDLFHQPFRVLGRVLFACTKSANFNMIQYILEQKEKFQSNYLPSDVILLASDRSSNLFERYGSSIIHIDNGKGLSPLIIAAKYGYCKIVKYLLQHFPYPNIKDEIGMTMLMWAARLKDYDVSKCIIDTLLKLGANIFCTDRHGNTAANMAVDKGIRRYLLQKTDETHAANSTAGALGKVAVCFTGQIRSFSKIKEKINGVLLRSLKSKFLHVDTFAIQNYGDKKYNEEVSFFNYSLPSTGADEIDSSTFRDGLNLKTARSCYQYSNVHGFYGSLMHVFRMWKDVSKCKEAIESAEKKHNTKYDAIVRWRYDYEPVRIDIEHLYDLDGTIYNSERDVGIEDSLAFGPRHLMMEYISYPIKWLHQWFKSGNICNTPLVSERLFQEAMVAKNVNIEYTPFLQAKKKFE